MNLKNRKKYWGEPTWFLFHGIAANINEEYYNKNYEDCFSIITSICHILPCPFCRKHAVDYLKKIKKQDINTKQKLIHFLYEFHNHANKNSGNPLFDIEKLEMYNRIRMDKVMDLFVNRFYTTYYSFKVFDGWRRNKNKDFFYNWIKKHGKYIRVVY